MRFRLEDNHGSCYGQAETLDGLCQEFLRPLLMCARSESYHLYELSAQWAPIEGIPGGRFQIDRMYLGPDPRCAFFRHIMSFGYSA